jgi:hypothetical protein
MCGCDDDSSSRVGQAQGVDSKVVDMDELTTPGEVAAAAIAWHGADPDEWTCFEDFVGLHTSDGTPRMAAIDSNPFVPWLASRLLHKSAHQQLFAMRSDSTVTMVIDWEIGDRSRWYIGEVWGGERSGTLAMRHVLWPHFLELVTPQGPDDDPTVEAYELPGVEPGDIVEFRLYEFDRTIAISPVHLDVKELVETPGARPVLVLPLPVVVADPR